MIDVNAPATSATTVPVIRRLRVPSHVAFVAISAALLSFFVAAGAPTPLFPLYEKSWGFAPSLLTVAFGVYAFGLIASLLVVGGLSDYVGRRPMLIGALLLELVATIVFLFATSIEWVILARVLQGIATGVASSTFGAAIVELAPDRRKKLGALMTSLMTTAGLGIGALFAGLVAFAIPAAAATTVWIVLIVLMMAGTVFAILTPETSARRPGARGSLVPRLAVPVQVRRLFAITAPSLVSMFLATALFLGLIPTILGGVFGVTQPLVGGVINFVMFGAATLTAALANAIHPHALKLFGNIGILLGTVLILAGIELHNLGPLWASAVIAGAGIGATFSGSTRGLLPEVKPYERAGLLAAIFTVSYLTFGLSAIVAGFVATAAGVRTMAVGFGLLTIVVAVFGLVLSGGAVVRARKTASA
jgi:MFS family permease